MASFKSAITWIAVNDYNDWLINLDPPSLIICMVADLWGKDLWFTVASLHQELERLYPLTWSTQGMPTRHDIKKRYGGPR